MSLREAKELAKVLGIEIRRSFGGEYRVNFIGGLESTDYYTDDLNDAIDTAYAMGMGESK